MTIIPVPPFICRERKPASVISSHTLRSIIRAKESTMLTLRCSCSTFQYTTQDTYWLTVGLIEAQLLLRCLLRVPVCTRQTHPFSVYWHACITLLPVSSLCFDRSNVSRVCVECMGNVCQSSFMLIQICLEIEIMC